MKDPLLNTPFCEKHACFPSDLGIGDTPHKDGTHIDISDARRLEVHLWNIIRKVNVCYQDFTMPRYIKEAITDAMECLNSPK